MNVLIKITSIEDTNHFFLEGLDGGPEEHCLLAELSAASHLSAQSVTTPTFNYYIIPDEDWEDFQKFYYITLNPDRSPEEEQWYLSHPKYWHWIEKIV